MTSHFEKRRRVDAGCFEDHLNIRPPSQLTEEAYALRADDAVANAWAEYEGEWKDGVTGDYQDAAAYYVDSQLVVAITDGFRRRFRTCYHKHFREPHGIDPAPGESLGDLQLKYRTWLRGAQGRGKIRRLKPIHGV